MSAAAATGMCAATATAMATTATAVPAASGCNSYALADAEFAFSIEDVKGREAYVGDFLLAEKDPTCVVLRRYVHWCGRRCAAGHGQGHAGRS